MDTITPESDLEFRIANVIYNAIGHMIWGGEYDDEFWMREVVTNYIDPKFNETHPEEDDDYWLAVEKTFERHWDDRIPLEALLQNRWWYQTGDEGFPSDRFVLAARRVLEELSSQ